MKINEITASSVMQAAKSIKKKVKKATTSTSHAAPIKDKGEPVLQQLAKSLKGLKGEFNRGASLGAKLLSR